MWNKKWRSERDWNKYSSGFILGKTKNNHGILNLALFADTFDECLPAILTLIQHSLMEICWENEALTFSSSLANKTPFKQWAAKETLTATATRTEIKTHFKTKITNRRSKKEGSWQAAERWNPWPAVVLSAGRPVLHHQPPPLIQLWAKNKREQKRWPRELQPAGTDAWRWPEPSTYLLNEHILALEINLGVCRNLFEIQPLAPSHDTWWSLEIKTQQKGINAQSLKVCGK